MIDNNGYIVVSETQNDTGKFFGSVNGGVMEAMVQNGTFQQITVYDWQALCFRNVKVSSDAHITLTPFRLILGAVKLILGQLFWALARINSIVGVLADSAAYEDEPAYVDRETDGPTQRPKSLRKGQNQEEEDYFNRNQTELTEDIPYPCDKQYDLYDLDESNMVKNDGLDRMNTECKT